MANFKLVHIGNLQIINQLILIGFDSNGRFYDQNGNFYPDESKALWTNKWLLETNLSIIYNYLKYPLRSISVYENRTQCLVDQFNEFFKHESNKTKVN